MADISTSKTEAQRLASTYKTSEQRMQGFRNQRQKFMRDFAGPNYGEGNDENWRQPLNLIYSVATTLEPFLALRGVRTGVQANGESGRTFAAMMQGILDYVLRKIKAAHAMRRALRDSFYGMGIVKTASQNAGELPTCDYVSFDDYVIDHRTRDRNPGRYAFEGHRFRMVFDEAIDKSSGIDKKGRDFIKSLSQHRIESSHKAEKISKSNVGPYNSDDFESEIEMVEIYLPRTQRIVWLYGNLDESTGTFLREFDWYGHESGPYSLLGLSWLNDNAISVPLMGIIYDLYQLENEVGRRIGRRSLAQKDIGLVDAPTPSDGRAVRDAQDGQIIQGKDIKGSVLSLGGPTKDDYFAADWFQQAISRISGNTDLLGGMKAQSGTLGQEEMLMANASVRTNDMRNFVIQMGQEIVEKLSWYIWNDPDLEISQPRSLGGGVQWFDRWVPEDRTGRWSDYDYTVKAYSTYSDSAEDKARRLATWVERYIAPFAALAAQQGSRLNVDLLANLSGLYLDIDGIEDLYEEGEPVEQASRVSGQLPGGMVSPARRSRPASPEPVTEGAAT